MGLISSILTSAVKDVAEDVLVASISVVETGVKVVGTGIDKTTEIVDGIQRKQASKFLKNEKQHSHLIIIQEKNTPSIQYAVFDSSEKIKYQVLGAQLGRKHDIFIYDVQNVVVGRVVQMPNKLHNPLSFEHDHLDFMINMNGTKLGIINTYTTAIKKNIDINFNGWSVDGDVFALNYSLIADDTLMMKADYKRKVGGNAYYLDIINSEHELECLLIAVAIAAAKKTKSEMTRNSKK